MSDQERQIEQSWIANAGAWTEVIRNGMLESRRLVTNDAILAVVQSLQPSRVLDVGCGEGWLAHRLESTGMEVVGFDANAELVARASEQAGTFFARAYADFVESPDDVGDSFDVAICNFSLLGQAIRPVMAACRNVLNSGGHIVIQTVHPFSDSADGRYEDGWREETFAKMPVAFEHTMPWYFRTVETWVSEVHQAGFDITALTETIHPESGRPLSLILVARAKIS